MLQKRLELALKILIGLTFFVPLAFFPSSFVFPFIVPKIVIFRSLVLLMLGVYLVLLIMNWKKYRIRFTLVNILVGLFALSFIISTFLSVDWYKSLWDSHERMLGLFTVLHYVIYYFIITSVVKKWDDWRWLLRTFLFAGGIVMFIALIQQFNNEFLLNTSGSRSAATLGNAIYVGGYSLFLTFIGLLLVIREKHILWRYFAGLGGLLGFLGIFFSGSRGALLGLMVGVGVLCIFYFITLKNSRKIKLFLGSFILIVVVTISILYSFRDTIFVRNIPSIGRLLNTSLTTGTRIMAWDIAIEGWKEKPAIGWGPGTYFYVFNKYYRPEFLRYGYRETWFDNAHNIVLNTLTERGVFGVIIYLGLFGAAVVMLLRGYRRKSINPHVAIVSISFLLAHLAQTVSAFENPTSYLYFFFFLAFVNSQIVYGSNYEEEGGSSQVQLSVGAMTVVGLAILLLIYSTNINPARANMAANKVIVGIYKLEDIRPLYEKAINIPTPHIDDISYGMSHTVGSYLKKYVEAGKADLGKELFGLAYNELNKNRELHPLDVRVHREQTILIRRAAVLSGDNSLLLEAEKIMEDAMDKSPKRQQFIYAMAGIRIQLEKYDEAEALYRQAIEDDSKIGESYWRLALLYDFLGNIEEAKLILDEAQNQGAVIGSEKGKMAVGLILEKFEELNKEEID